MRAGVDVETAVVIERPREDAAAYAANPDNATAWYRNIKTVRWLTAPELASGSRIAFEARFLGRTLNYTYEIVEHIPGERLVMRTDQGPFPMKTTYTWQDGMTRMTLRNAGMPTGFSKFAAPFLSTAMRVANKQDLARLKRILEDRGSS